MPPRDLRRELQADTAGRHDLAMWNPQPGDIITGRLAGYVSRQTKRGPARIAVIDTDDGERRGVWVTSTVLKGHFEQEAPRPGDRLGIKYGGRHETKGYHLFSFVIERAEGNDFQPSSVSLQPQARGYAATTMAAPARRSAAPSVVSLGPADDDENDPFRN